MDEKFLSQFEALLDKYTELLIGESNEDLKEKVKVWALYSYIAKSMPPLAKHWNELYPEAKEEVKTIISEIKKLNEAHRQHGSRDQK
ncbi:DUF2573 domain-containing protein [Bacillus sp. V3-13]|uniref:YusU family protein n=1 Tax=Bacillus sp. V3-13 TaxID=2053728 RepID=UPI000C75C46A|nr:YusU family protein [Bacillus sp. V3-13]PLR79308.1 DUF2573 domain-containing protein [Bacillus sp. V3-13]